MGVLSVAVHNSDSNGIEGCQSIYPFQSVHHSMDFWLLLIVVAQAGLLHS